MANDPRHFRIKFSRSYSIDWCDNKFFDKLRELVKNSEETESKEMMKIYKFFLSFRPHQFISGNKKFHWPRFKTN